MKNNSIITQKKDTCCGCRNCENICPQNAIEMKKDGEGFLYPNIDTEKCVDCGLCRKVCPWINEIKRDEYLKIPICYGCKNKDKEILKKSTSGGLFSILAMNVLENNGFVVGCALDDDLQAKHICVETKEDLYNILGSKYVISDLNEIFKTIETKLQEEKQVLFSGVPCQIAALKNFLKRDYEKLIMAEVICHGVPSQELFSKYIESLEKKYKSKIIKFNFRDKQVANWGTFKASALLQSGKKKVINADFDKYYWSFLCSKNYRESCYKCKFAQKERNADFTLGDFWGIEKLAPQFVDYNGVSVLIINTQKGLDIFEKIKDNIDFISVNYDDVCKFNGQLREPSKRPTERDEWYNNFNDDKFIEKIKINNNIRDYIKILFPQKLKFKIKKIIKKRR